MSRKFYSEQNYRFKLDESDDNIVFSEDEYVFLKNKKTGLELCIDDHYGNPTSGLILMNNDYKDTHVIITGCGLSIYDIESDELKRFWNEPDSMKFPDGLYYPSFADEYQFGFVMDSDSSNGLRVFMGHAETLEFKEIK